MRHETAGPSSALPAVVLESFALAPHRCVFRDEERGVRLYHADCLEFMDALGAAHPSGVFDMVFADPPYFLSNGGITCHAGKMVRVDKGQWDKSQGAELNHEFNLAWISRCQKVLRPNGTLWVSGTHHVIHSVGCAMQQLGMKILNDITWEKPNPPPNLSCRYFTHSTETIIWAAKSEKSKHRFNYRAMREMNAGKQMKSVWRLAAPGAEETGCGRHPTQKPRELLERIILASTAEGDLVFDPFAGSATTGVAAIALRRAFAGCELDANFFAMSVRRLEKELAAHRPTAGDAGARAAEPEGGASSSARGRPVPGQPGHRRGDALR